MKEATIGRSVAPLREPGIIDLIVMLGICFQRLQTQGTPEWNGD